MPKSSYLFMAALAVAAAESPVIADDTPADDATKAAIQKLEAKKQLNEAQIAYINSLGIPAFEGKSELKDGAGDLEAALLSTYAIEAAGNKIQTAVSPAKPVIVLAGDEAFDLSAISSLKQSFDVLDQVFTAAEGAKPKGVKRAPPQAAPPSTLTLADLLDKDTSQRLNSALGLPAAVAIANAAAGLFRSDVTVTPAVVKIDDATLAAVVAGKAAGANAYLPSQATGAISDTNDLLTKWTRLGVRRTKAAAARAAQGVTPSADAKDYAAALDAAVSAYDSLAAIITKVDATGVSPLMRAARWSELPTTDAYVLRVYAVQSGGSIVTSKNIGTTFGADPIRVSGGLIARYSLTGLKDGQVKSSGVFACRTVFARLRDVQGNKAIAQPSAHCFP